MTAVPDAARGQVVRGWTDGMFLLAGTLVLVLSALPVHRTSVEGWERDIFRGINDTVTLPFALVWPVMQLGNIVVVPVAAAAAALTRRFRLAAGIALGGAAVYLLAKVVKGVVVRGRPASLLPEVNIAGAASSGRGFVSGHAAVVALIATVAWPYLGRGGRAAVVVLAVAVWLARVYVGAHLPLDIVGGAALGVAVGGLVRCLLGRPAPC